MGERVGSAADLLPGEPRLFDVNGIPVCVVSLGEAGFRAVGDICSHEEAHLHEGEVELDDGTIECPLHGSVFDLTSGQPRSLPATRPIPVYEVTVEGDDLMIEVNA